jgi:hypothetical protein
VRRHVGLLGHTTSLYDDLTVADNVRFWCRAAGARATDADAALAALGLDGRLRDVPVTRLSAGQRRRTSLAVLLARRAELWLLDEPHAGLDRDGRDLLDGLVRSAVGQGATVVVASHEHERSAALADRVVPVAGLRTGTGPAPLGAPCWAPGWWPRRTSAERWSCVPVQVLPSPLSCSCSPSPRPRPHAPWPRRPLWIAVLLATAGVQRGHARDG